MPLGIRSFSTQLNPFIHSSCSLGPMAFGPPKKVPSIGTQDALPYVSFIFLYRSRGNNASLDVERAPNSPRSTY